MTAAAGWAAGCIVVASVLILLACVTVPPLRRRRTDAAAPAPVEPQPDDFPTAPIPRVPADPTPAPRPRSMLRREDLLWHKGAEDGEGVITLGLLQAPAGQLGVLMDVDGEAVGVRLDRPEVQGLRDALTNHLVHSARSVTQ